MSQDTLIAELAAAVDGLFYPSESDEPFEPFVWPAADGRTARQAVERHAVVERPLASQTVEAFFSDLTGSDDAERFAALRALLEDRLTGLKVYRAGETQVDVYLIGRHVGGWAGLRTRSIET